MMSTQRSRLDDNELRPANNNNNNNVSAGTFTYTLTVRALLALLNPLEGRCVNCHPGLTYICNF